MLDQLVESSGTYQNSNRRGGIMLTCGFLVFSLFASGITWSLFARDLDMASGNLELSALMLPVTETEPAPVVEPIREVRETEPARSPSNEVIRRDNIARTDEPIAPTTISNTPSATLARPRYGDFSIRSDAPESNGSSVGPRTGNDVGRSSGPSTIRRETAKVDDDDDKVEPPTIKKPEPKAATPKGPIKVSELLNGRAVSLPKPEYPAPAKAIRAQGEVRVQVTIDEQGRVISANAMGGHPLLRDTSERAARGARFSPTILGGVPVKVTGLIVYRFIGQ